MWRRRRRRSLFVFIDTVEGPRAPAVKWVFAWCLREGQV